MTREAGNDQKAPELPFSSPDLQLVWGQREYALAVFCEAAVATLGYGRDADGLEWWGGNSKAIDVIWEDPEHGSMTVDVKRGFLEDVITENDAQEKSPHLGFMGSRSRVEQVRENVSHYSLVVPHGPTSVSFHPSRGFHIRGPRALDVYMIPRAVVNERFKAKRNRAGDPTGMNRYAPLDEMSPFLVHEFRFDSVDAAGCAGDGQA